MSGQRVRLTFPPELIREPLIGVMVQRYGVLPNIRRADVSDDMGWIVCELDGPPDKVTEAIAWIESTGVEVDLLDNPLEG